MHPELQAAWPFKNRTPRRVVVKVGSNVLALPQGGLNPVRIGALCDSVAALRRAGAEVILVSSGAVAAGRGLLGLKEKPKEIPELQAVAAIGQGALMEAWSVGFRRHGILPAQVLLTRDDMEDRRRYLNARLALLALLGHGAVAVINENDTVTIDELKFGDNDMLSAMVAAKMEADLLVIMSNVPGLLTAHPKEDPNAKLVPVVREVNAQVEGLVHAQNSTFGTGGMRTKLLAARHATQFGTATLIVDGRVDGQLERILDASIEGTLFTARAGRKAGSARRHWITTRRPHGTLTIDAGAQKALEARRSLLAIGIRAVQGEFKEGDVVAVENEEGHEIALGIVNHDSDLLGRIRGLHQDEITALVGPLGYGEVIHSNNLVLSAAGPATD